MSGPFASAVRRAIQSGTDTWECYYYMGNATNSDGAHEWSANRQNVYMETRKSALGPEWAEWRTTIMRIQHHLRYG